jgi:hypothetical protein
VQIQKVVASLHGEIMQVPPAYSNVKFKGKPLFKYTQQGRVIRLCAPRSVPCVLLCTSLDTSLLLDRCAVFCSSVTARLMSRLCRSAGAHTCSGHVRRGHLWVQLVHAHAAHTLACELLIWWLWGSTLKLWCVCTLWAGR